MGRPKLGIKGKVQSVRVRLTAKERAAIEKAKGEQSLSAFVREAALKAARARPGR